MNGQMVEFSFEQPLLESSKGLPGLMFQQIGKVSDLIRDPSFQSTDGRLELMIHHIISSFIVDIDEQMQFRTELDKLIHDYTEKEDDLIYKGVVRNRACLEFEGRVLSRLHNILGTTRNNRVGFTWDPEKCKIIDFTGKAKDE
jgi:hypothetical protein